MAGSRSRSPTLESVAVELLSYLTEEIQEDLRAEDPTIAVEVHFGPLACQPMPRSKLSQGSCSIDGLYVPEVDVKPWIIYADDVHKDRVRFTIMHELGHHLLATIAAALLDDIDAIAGSGERAITVEEAVCHRLAGRILVPDPVLASGIGDNLVVPEHVVKVHELAAASWEAVVVRVAETMPNAGAVVLVRDSATVAFCAASPRLGWSWWPRGCRLDPAGPLARSLQLAQTARRELYRFDLAYARAMFCDTLPVHSRLAIGVLSERPSDGSLSIIEPAEPAWKERSQFCEWCPGVERDRGWCYRCRGPYCPECDRCGCTHPVRNPLCPECGLLKAFRPGASMCRDCEADRA